MRRLMLDRARGHVVQYHWSSVHANLAPCEDSRVPPHACFIAMGDTPPVRAEAYRAWLKQRPS